jgi:hypothetical protein
LLPFGGSVYRVVYEWLLYLMVVSAWISIFSQLWLWSLGCCVRWLGGCCEDSGICYVVLHGLHNLVCGSVTSVRQVRCRRRVFCGCIDWHLVAVSEVSSHTLLPAMLIVLDAINRFHVQVSQNAVGWTLKTSKLLSCVLE